MLNRIHRLPHALGPATASPAPRCSPTHIFPATSARPAEPMSENRTRRGPIAARKKIFTNADWLRDPNNDQPGGTAKSAEMAGLQRAWRKAPPEEQQHGATAILKTGGGRGGESLGPSTLDARYRTVPLTSSRFAAKRHLVLGIQTASVTSMTSTVLRASTSASAKEKGRNNALHPPPHEKRAALQRCHSSHDVPVDVQEGGQLVHGLLPVGGAPRRHRGPAPPVPVQARDVPAVRVRVLPVGPGHHHGRAPPVGAPQLQGARHRALLPHAVQLHGQPGHHLPLEPRPPRAPQVLGHGGGPARHGAAALRERERGGIGGSVDRPSIDGETCVKRTR
ncbi:hypothetical protein ON010_g8025 [Phytophthora cinnamomi]|nr:hypothetical protein ON010_g8025 [Phytophthora cinnamomi]